MSKATKKLAFSIFTGKPVIFVASNFQCGEASGMKYATICLDFESLLVGFFVSVFYIDDSLISL